VKGGRRIAVEIETGNSDAAANVRKCLEAGVERVLVVPTSKQARQRLIRALGAGFAVGRPGMPLPAPPPTSAGSALPFEGEPAPIIPTLGKKCSRRSDFGRRNGDLDSGLSGHPPDAVRGSGAQNPVERSGSWALAGRRRPNR